MSELKKRISAADAGSSAGKRAAFGAIAIVGLLVTGCDQSPARKPQPSTDHLAAQAPRSVEEAVATKAMEERSTAGARAIAQIQKKYAGVRGIEVTLFGEATATPSIGIYLPIPEFRALKPDQIGDIAAHLQVHIVRARTNPRAYVTMDSAAPFYPRAVQNVRGIKRGAWFIGAGRDDGEKMYFDHVEISGQDYRK